MQEILRKDLCTGCGACMNICPKAAIHSVVDNEGFEYPYINQALCVDCKLCQAVCPVIHVNDNREKTLAENSIQRAFAARNRNQERRVLSSSGGIFPVLAEYVLEQGGIVVGASFDNSFRVVQRIISSKDELQSLQGSKYLQSMMDTIFKEIRSGLEKGRTVLFSGLACQIEGLRSFLRRDYENLYCIDLICMGIPSPGVWGKYIEHYFKGEKIEAINFKDKTSGWNRFSVLINTDRRHFLQIGKDNVFMQCMFKSYSIRPSCFGCKFKKKERASDLTLADCWGTNRLAKKMDDNKGLSSVVVHTKKGEKLWNAVSEGMDLKEVTIDDVCEGNPNMVEVKTSRRNGRCLFYYLLNHVSVGLAFNIMCRNHQLNVKSSIKHIVKAILGEQQDGYKEII